MQLKSLPTLLTTAQVDALVAQFPAVAVVHRYEFVITVYAPDGQRVFSAIRYQAGSDLWHVMAVPTLIELRP